MFWLLRLITPKPPFLLGLVHFLQAIIGLLLDASSSSDERIQSYYFRFLENLTPEQLVGFKQEGLTIPEQYMRKPGLLPTPLSRQYAYMPR